MSNPGPWAIDVVHVGTIPVLPLAGFIPGAPAGARLDVECFAFLLTGAMTTIVVDTGPHEALAGAAGFTAVGDAAGALRTALAARGRNERDVSAVVHTHLHYDHMQNDGLFPSAEIAVSERELEAARRGGREEFYVGLEAFCQQAGPRMRLLGDGTTLLAPGVEVVATGGHTAGHQAVVVQTAGGPVCLAGDEVPLAINLLQPSQTGYHPAATGQFLRRARQLAWLVVPSHDPGLQYVQSIPSAAQIAAAGNQAR